MCSSLDPILRPPQSLPPQTRLLESEAVSGCDPEQRRARVYFDKQP